MTGAAGAPSDSLAAFEAGLAQIPWFSALGQPPTAAEESDAAASLAGLASVDIQIAWIADLLQAQEVLQRPDPDSVWLAVEVQEETRLNNAVSQEVARLTLTDRLNRLMHAASDAAVGPAAMACSRAGIADEALPKVAAGAASQAVVQMALVRAAAADPATHPFAARYRLFTAGRWPLVIVGGALYVL